MRKKDLEIERLSITITFTIAIAIGLVVAIVGAVMTGGTAFEVIWIFLWFVFMGSILDIYFCSFHSLKIAYN